MVGIFFVLFFYYEEFPYISHVIKNNKTMATLKFSDGMEFDTSGPLRKEMRSDGLYVVGNGMLIPVRDNGEAEKFLKRFKKSE